MPNQLLAPWLIETALVGYRDCMPHSPGNIAGLPLPREFAAVFIVFGALSFLPEKGEKVAALLGWGFVIATALKLLDPTSAGTGIITKKTAAKNETIVKTKVQLSGSP